ncbi:MAG: glycosyltransferase [Alphaproteobacteria bacterium]|nr:glycosyltransferase [Alphaproteobacteria bacterium]
MHILVCSSHPHLPETRGGLQTSTDDLCHALSARGYGVTLLCGTDKSDCREVLSGVSIVRAQHPDHQLAPLARDVNAALVLIQSGRSVANLLADAVETGRPTAVYLHNVELHRIGGILPPDPRILYFANSRFTAERWWNFFGIQCVVLPPVIRGDRYRGTSSGDRILFVNPIPEKGLERVMRLAAANPDLPFVIVESWTTDLDWRRWLFQRFGALANVEWRVATDDMPALYANSRILLMPSVWEEAFGRTVIEAQLSGVPCITSRRGGLPEAVGEGGVILDLDAADSDWSSALRQLYFDVAHWARLSAAALANAAHRLSLGEQALIGALEHIHAHVARCRV